MYLQIDICLVKQFGQSWGITYHYEINLSCVLAHDNFMYLKVISVKLKMVCDKPRQNFIYHHGAEGIK